jgi:predicted transglutaminase-like cysteine proteinase
MSLRALGFPQDRMRVVVLHDLNLNVPHAVMSIEHGGRTLILDNQVSRVVPHETIRHCRPIYSVNETHWWLHRA